MKKVFCAAILVSFTAILSAQVNYLPKGFIFNESGGKCWHTQSTSGLEGPSYFYKGLKGINGTMTFDDSSCMVANGVQGDVNKMMINNIIVRWHGKPDSDFATKTGDLVPAGGMRTKGFCIQSRKYPMVGVTVDYILKSGKIISVIHDSAAGGCSTL